FSFFLFATFPFDAVRQRLETEAGRAGYTLRVGSLGPAFFGVTASRLQLSPAAGGDAAEPLLVPSVTLRPSLFPPGASFHAKAFGGRVSGSVSAAGDALDVEFSGLDPAQGNIRGFTGVDLAGRIGGRARLSLPRATAPGSKAKAPDLSRADGIISLEGSGLSVNGGNVTMPLMGQPTPVDLPKVVLGNLQARITFVKGLGTLEVFQAKGSDLDISASGTLKLARKIDYSEPNVDVKIKADPEFVKRLGLLGSGLSLLPADRSDPGQKVAKITGYLGKPRFAPGARN
ncbi:MAG TPA: type II secretion system protein GspN, partial [Myxococcaceae bacterium]|nr:type II secretion system protein GspN [Myxococcaceae bacterium]